MKNLFDLYKSEVIEKLQTELGIKNIHMVPTLDKVVINVGLGEAVTNPAALEVMEEELKQITGQKPIITKSRGAISNFKIRTGDKIGIKVTLRKKRMWDFMEKLISVVLPRIKDFRGISTRSFDGKGNYTLGISEQTVFPESDPNKLDKLRGLQVIIVTTAENDEHGLKLLEKLGMPFVKKSEEKTLQDIDKLQAQEQEEREKMKKAQNQQGEIPAEE